MSACDYLTLADISEELGVSRRTVERWVDMSALPALRLPGRAIRVRRADYDEFLEKARTTPGGRRRPRLALVTTDGEGA